MESTMVVAQGTDEIKNGSSNEEDKHLIVAAPDSDVKEITVLAESKKKRNRIQVSKTKKPFFYYYNLAKRHIKQYDEVELSALGMAIPTVVTIAEILKNNGFAVEKRLMISSVCFKKGENDRVVLKPKIEIALVSAEKINKVTNVIAPNEDC